MVCLSWNRREENYWADIKFGTILTVTQYKLRWCPDLSGSSGEWNLKHSQTSYVLNLTWCVENNIAGMKVLSLNRPVYKTGPWLASGKLPGFLLSRVLIRVAPCAETVQNNVLYPEQLLSFWEYGFLVHGRHCVSIWPATSKKNLGTESLMSLSGRQYFMCHSLLLE